MIAAKYPIGLFGSNGSLSRARKTNFDKYDTKFH